MNHIPRLFADNEMMLFVASVLIQATLVIVLALAAGRLLRHRPVLRHSILLGGLLCVCFCPAASFLAGRIDTPLIAISWPSYPTSRPHQTVPVDTHESVTAALPESTSSPAELPDTVASLPPNVSGGQPVMSPEVLETDSVFPQFAPEQVSVASSTVLPEKAPTARSVTEVSYDPVWMTVPNIAGLIWLVGMAMIAIRLFLAWQYLNRLRTIASPIDEQNLPQLQELSEEVLRAVAATRLPPLLIADQLKGPISLGLFRPAIILPRGMIQALTASQLRDVLIHEMAHIRRNDHVVVLLQRLAGAFFWPFPLVRLLNAKIDQAREDVCDNYVLRSTEASQYSRMLLQLTERAAPQAIPLAIGLWKCRRKLEQRVNSLLDPRRTTGTRLPRLTLCTLAVAFMSIAVLLAGSRIIPTSDVQAAESPQPAGEEVAAPARDDAKKESAKKESDKNDVTKRSKPVAATENDQDDPYDRLYDVIMTRWKDGKAYGQDETSPAIFTFSEFPFDDRTFDKFNSALDAFAALPQEEIEQYSDVQRALMQRNLWDVFEYTFNWDWPEDWWWEGQRSFPKTHMERRNIAQPKIASLIKRLALSKDQILALPDTMAATVKSGKFEETHDPADPFKPFLPRDLNSTTESSWICVGEDGEEIPADLHTGRAYNRSMFLQFLRLPGGRAETLEYMDRIRKRPHQFPVGTQFALLERPFLISKDGELVLSPLVTSIQLRAYLNVGRRFEFWKDDAEPTQCVAEFVMQPRQLMRGNAVMKAPERRDVRFEAGDVDTIWWDCVQRIARCNLFSIS